MALKWGFWWCVFFMMLLFFTARATAPNPNLSLSNMEGYQIATSRTAEMGESRKANDFGAQDSRTAALAGKLLATELQKDWRPKPQKLFIGPNVYETE